MEIVRDVPKLKPRPCYDLPDDLVEIVDIHVKEKFLRSGADAAVSHAFIGGMRMASELIRPDTVTFLDKMLRATDRTVSRIWDPSLKAGITTVSLGRRPSETEGKAR